ncbi:MAG: peptidoglycan-binding protein [Myxococcaceae bacterium]
MKVLTHRVLPKEAKAVKNDLAAITRHLKADKALNLGDTGKGVAALQRQLAAANVYRGPVNGQFDAATAAAVATLQKAKHLEASGVMGGKTLKALESTELFVKDNFQTPAKIGQSGSDIRGVERRLEKLGFRPGKADGVFDQATAEAVERYRKADPQVSDKGKSINKGFAHEVALASKRYNHAAYTKREIGNGKQHTRLDAATGKAAARGDGIGAGDKGRAVLNVEKHLEAAGFELGKSNATWGSRTTAATKAFQKASGLPETGVVDARTWSKLKGKLFSAKGAATPAQRKGERDGAVMNTEKKLKKLGYNPGSVDGPYSSSTEKAVKKFQRKHHLQASGAVGSSTLAAITKALKERAGGKAEKILDTARKYLGFHERGNNGNPFSSALGRPPEAWCADFVSFCAKKAGLKLNTASAEGVATYLKSRGTWKGRHNPQPGDALAFRWDGSHGWADHVGIVEKVFTRNGVKYVQTIEGNSSDGVRRKTYPANSSVINGYGTIK